jgi:hypothetical protein
MSASPEEAIILAKPLAAEEPNPKPKAEFEKQAEARRKMASERASKLGLPAPPNDTN